MKDKKFEVKIYYSSFCTVIVEDENEVGALGKARRQKVDKNEIMTNLEPWEEADTIEEIKENYEKNRK